jgi:S-adenosylmethionine synthetase
VTHVGKLYAWTAPRIARGLVAQIDAVEEARCTLVSRIGHPVHEPALAALELRTADGLPLEAIRGAAEEIARAELARLTGEFWTEWLDLPN